jgi:hypothetical protein
VFAPIWVMQYKIPCLLHDHTPRAMI